MAVSLTPRRRAASRVGDYDPHVIDELQIKISLGRIAKRRNAAKAQIKKQAT
jgi:hypothetical protein